MCFFKKVVVNGQHLFDYNHRIPLYEVTKLAINGQIDCYSLKYVGVSKIFN